MSYPAQAADGSQYGEKELQFKSVKFLKDGTVEITFVSQPETLYYCPGANAEETGKGLVLTFVRASIKRKPKVDHPAEYVKQSPPAQIIKVNPKAKPVFLKDGKKLIQIYPEK